MLLYSTLTIIAIGALALFIVYKFDIDSYFIRGCIILFGGPMVWVVCIAITWGYFYDRYGGLLVGILCSYYERKNSKHRIRITNLRTEVTDLKEQIIALENEIMMHHKEKERLLGVHKELTTPSVMISKFRKVKI